MTDTVWYGVHFSAFIQTRIIHIPLPPVGMLSTVT